MSAYRPYPKYKSRALPFATFGCPFGADDLRPEGATYDSPGHRPGSVAKIYILCSNSPSR
jgi:hypothetical protein